MKERQAHNGINGTLRRLQRQSKHPKSRFPNESQEAGGNRGLTEQGGPRGLSEKAGSPGVKVNPGHSRAMATWSCVPAIRVTVAGRGMGKN